LASSLHSQQLTCAIADIDTGFSAVFQQLTTNSWYCHSAWMYE